VPVPPASPAPRKGSGFTRRMADWLGHHWWQGVGAMLAAVGILVTIIIYALGSPGSPAPHAGRSTAPAPTVPNVVNGNCNAQGQGNSVNCIYPPQPKSFGGVSLTPGPGPLFLFMGSAEDLPTPPDYPQSRLYSHCSDWGSWLSRQPGVYAINPTLFIDMIAGGSDLVVVNNVGVRVINRAALTGNYVLIDCKYGAGLDAGYQLTVNIATNVTDVLNVATGGRVLMPPASLSLSGRSFQGAQISINSTPARLYGGEVIVTAIVNGQQKSIVAGSPAHEFRWLDVSGYNDPIIIHAPAYDWSLTRHKWIRLAGPCPCAAPPT
jgi:hypothetical protein